MKLLLTSFVIGMIAGFVIVLVRLNLGLPGHKALFWMVPAITIRLIGRCKVSAMIAALGTVFTTFSLGGRLAGGALGLGMIVLAGFILDITINFMEQQKWPNGSSILLLSMTAMLCNLLCLAKKLVVPDGWGVHLLYSSSDFWFRLGSYAFFGFISGTIAGTIAFCVNKRR